MRKLTQAYAAEIMRDRNQSENEEYFNYLGSNMMTNDARCTREIKMSKGN